MNYHIWTEGCQMNVADSQRISACLESLGYERCKKPENADVIILNTCVVRQSAEDRAFGRLQSLKPFKEKNPGLVINLMGCLVGNHPEQRLKEKLHFVDVFSAPSDMAPLLDFLQKRDVGHFQVGETPDYYTIMDSEIPLPASEREKTVCGFIPVVYGCSHACSFCIIPLKRGGEQSRPAEHIIHEAEEMTAHGVREITLLGQIVDRYGLDKPGFPSLANLIERLSRIENLKRIRFLTSHPNWMTDELIEVVASNPKVCPHVEIPIQAGNDEILAAMRRGYTTGQYRSIVEKIRRRIPGVSIGTDVIVGFPGETEAHFMDTYQLLAELKLDVIHLARYSPRPGTLSARKMADDVTPEEKMRRFRLIEDLFEKISLEKYENHIDQSVEVLFEDQVKGKWRGRSETNKLVFCPSAEDLRGKIIKVKISKASAWSMQGEIEAGENRR